jgi:hypothetical protein
MSDVPVAPTNFAAGADALPPKIRTPQPKILLLFISLGVVVCGGMSLLAVALSAPRPITLPAGAPSLVLQMDEAPGYRWGASMLENGVHPGPLWSLYSDGTLVYLRDAAWYSGTLALPAMQALLRQVIDQQQFFDTDEHYIAATDLGYTTFLLNADGRTHQTRVDGIRLSQPAPLVDQLFNTHATGPQRLGQTAALLVATVPPNAQLYRPAQARLLIQETDPQANTPTPWPFPAVALHLAQPTPTRDPASTAPSRAPWRVVELRDATAAQALAFAPAVRYVQQGAWYAYVLALPELP